MVLRSWGVAHDDPVAPSPELQRRPEPDYAKKKSATSAARRRERVAVLTDRWSVGAARGAAKG